MRVEIQTYSSPGILSVFEVFIFTRSSAISSSICKIANHFFGAPFLFFKENNGPNCKNELLVRAATNFPAEFFRSQT